MRNLKKEKIGQRAGRPGREAPSRGAHRRRGAAALGGGAAAGWRRGAALGVRGGRTGPGVAATLGGRRRRPPAERECDERRRGGKRERSRRRRRSPRTAAAAALSEDGGTKLGQPAGVVSLRAQKSLAVSADLGGSGGGRRASYIWRGHWSRFVAPTGTNVSTVPVDATNRDQ
jgi:hypothetical protein